MFVSPSSLPQFQMTLLKYRKQIRQARTMNKIIGWRSLSRFFKLIFFTSGVPSNPKYVKRQAIRAIARYEKK